MKRVKISIEDLMAVLEAMSENGTKEIIFFEYNNMPAVCDADEPDNVISFQSVSEDGTVNEDDEVIH